MLLAATAGAQTPVIEKVDPPDWWASHSINPVRLLIRGRNLAGAQKKREQLLAAFATPPRERAAA